MKISLLTDGIYPQFVGGMQKHSTCLAKYLAAKGINVDLYLRVPEQGPSSLDDQFATGERARINLHYVPLPVSGYFPGHYLRQSYLYSSRIYEELKPHLDVDFIYAQGFTAWRLLKEKRKGLKTPPIGVNFHGLEMFQKAPSFKGWLQQWMFRPFVASILKSSDVVFSLGGKLREIITSVGVSGERIYNSPNGIESSWLVPEPIDSRAPRRFVFVGRYERRKGIEELAAVMEELAAEGAKCHFDLIGPIPPSLQSRRENITYWGTVTDAEQMKKILRNCDILLCPSYAEGMPTVILEALASGLAVIGSDVGAVSSMVSKNNGWLIAPGDRLQLKDTLLAAIAISSQELAALKRESLKRAQSFTWESVIGITIAEIGRAIAASARATKLP